MPGIIIADDLPTPCSRAVTMLTQIRVPAEIYLIPFQFRDSPGLAHPLDVAQALAATACEHACDAVAVLVNLNLATRASGPRAIRRQDRAGVVTVEALRRHASLLLPVYGCSFESPSALSRCEPFKLLFVDFADCNHYIRLPIYNCDLSLQRPDESRLQILAEILRSRQEKRWATETAATLRNSLSRFAHNQRRDLAALVGPVKAALRAGCYDLADRPETLEAIQSSLGQLKAEADLLPVESAVKESVLGEIGRLESLWDGASEAIRRIRGFPGSPEKAWGSRPEEALEKIAEFEERILEFQRG